MEDNRTYRDFSNKDAFLAWAAQRRRENALNAEKNGSVIVGTSRRPILGPSKPLVCPVPR